MVRPGQVLAIVPARGGSKSFPRKNIRFLGQHPLLAYSIAAGLQAQLVDRVIVSTDDEAIAAVALDYQAEVPFLRPAELAQDDTTDLPVFQHAVRWLEEHEDYRPDIIVQLRPTSPLRPKDCVDRAIRILQDHPAADSIRAIVPAGQNPYKMWRVTSDAMQPLLTTEFSEPYNMPRQKLPATYWQTGHLDAMRRTTLLVQHSMTGRSIYPLVLDRSYVTDIDTLRDLELAEWILQRGELDIVRPISPGKSLTNVQLLVLDFDGVLTDNRVIVSEDGSEAVRCHRGDGWGIARLIEAGVEVVVLSTEANPVVAARSRKLGMAYRQALDDKLTALQRLAEERSLGPDNIAYVGNDVNDLACLRWVGFPMGVADAVPEVLSAVGWTTRLAGGAGAVREVCDRILAARKGSQHDTAIENR